VKGEVKIGGFVYSGFVKSNEYLLDFMIAREQIIQERNERKNPNRNRSNYECNYNYNYNSVFEYCISF
jgi:hypothetical protein